MAPQHRVPRDTMLATAMTPNILARLPAFKFYSSNESIATPPSKSELSWTLIHPQKQIKLPAQMNRSKAPSLLHVTAGLSRALFTTTDTRSPNPFFDALEVALSNAQKLLAAAPAAAPSDYLMQMNILSVNTKIVAFSDLRIILLPLKHEHENLLSFQKIEKPDNLQLEDQEPNDFTELKNKILIKLIELANTHHEEQEPERKLIEWDPNWKTNTNSPMYSSTPPGNRSRASSEETLEYTSSEHTLYDSESFGIDCLFEHEKPLQKNEIEGNHVKEFEQENPKQEKKIEDNHIDEFKPRNSLQKNKIKDDHIDEVLFPTQHHNPSEVPKEGLGEMDEFLGIFAEAREQSRSDVPQIVVAPVIHPRFRNLLKGCNNEAFLGQSKDEEQTLPETSFFDDSDFEINGKHSELFKRREAQFKEDAEKLAQRDYSFVSLCEFKSNLDDISPEELWNFFLGIEEGKKMLKITEFDYNSLCKDDDGNVGISPGTIEAQVYDAMVLEDHKVMFLDYLMHLLSVKRRNLVRRHHMRAQRRKDKRNAEWWDVWWLAERLRWFNGKYTFTAYFLYSRDPKNLAYRAEKLRLQKEFPLNRIRVHDDPMRDNVDMKGNELGREQMIVALNIRLGFGYWGKFGWGLEDDIDKGYNILKWKAHHLRDDREKAVGEEAGPYMSQEEEVHLNALSSDYVYTWHRPGEEFGEQCDGTGSDVLNQVPVEKQWCIEYHAWTDKQPILVARILRSDLRAPGHPVAPSFMPYPRTQQGRDAYHSLMAYYFEEVDPNHSDLVEWHEQHLGRHLVGNHKARIACRLSMNWKAYKKLQKNLTQSPLWVTYHPDANGLYNYHYKSAQQQPRQPQAQVSQQYSQQVKKGLGLVGCSKPQTGAPRGPSCNYAHHPGQQLSQPQAQNNQQQVQQAKKDLGPIGPIKPKTGAQGSPYHNNAYNSGQHRVYPGQVQHVQQPVQQPKNRLLAPLARPRLWPQ